MSLSDSPARFHVTIVLYNSAEHIEACLESLMGQTLPPWRVTVLDNASSDDGAQRVAQGWPQVHLIHSDRNLGFAGGQNHAVASAEGADFVFLLNPDARMKATLLERLAQAFATSSRMGVLGCKAYEPDGKTIQHVGMCLKGNGLSGMVGQGEADRGQYQGVRPASSVLGAALAVRAETWRELGGLDERFWPGYFEETDLCWRARHAGWQVAVACDAAFTHLHGSHDRVRDPEFLERYFRNRARFLVKQYGPWDWVARYLPSELRWLLYWGSKGYRRLALRTLWQALRERDPNAASRKGEAAR